MRISSSAAAVESQQLAPNSQSDQEIDPIEQAEQIRASLSIGISDEIQTLRTLDNTRRVRDIFTFALLVGVGVSLVSVGRSYTEYGFILRIGGTVLIALVLNAFVLFLHEGMHGVLFRSRYLNHALSVLFGATALISFTAYKVLHTRHHSFLGDPRDPDDYNNYTSSKMVVWMLHYLRLATGCFVYILLIPFLSFRHGSPSERLSIVLEYLFLTTLYGALLTSVPFQLLVNYWLLPLLLVAFLIQIRGFSQHGITDAHDPYLASRTFVPNRLARFFLLNENYHLEHHIFPEVPSYHLPQLHMLLRSRYPRVVVGRSYLAFLLRFFRATFTLDETPIGFKPGNSSSKR